MLKLDGGREKKKDPSRIVCIPRAFAGFRFLHIAWIRTIPRDIKWGRESLATWALTSGLGFCDRPFTAFTAPILSPTAENAGVRGM